MTDRPLPADGRLPWPPLLRGKLVRRYQRFLADVVLDSGDAVTAHCPNTGAMISCCEPGRTVYLSRSDNPRRKLPYTWEIIDMGTSLVGVNTATPNRLVEHAVKQSKIPELDGYGRVRREVPYGDHSRIDLLMSGSDRPDCYIEVKNCTLVSEGVASFPDAVTARGLKHLHELVGMVRRGNRAAMFYFVQRMDAEAFHPADRIDPEYGIALRAAVDAGVEIMVYDVRMDLDGIELRRPLPWSL